MTDAPPRTPVPRRALLVALAGHFFWIGACLLSDEGGVWAPLGVAAVVVGLGCAWAWPAATLARLRPSAREAGLGLLVGVALAAATEVGFPLLASALPFLDDAARGLYAKMWQGPGPVLASPLLVLFILVEELLWRGVVQTALEEQRLGAGPLVLVTSALYALGQAGQGSLLLVGIALSVGLVFSALRTLTGGLLAPLLAHLVWDGVVLVALPLVDVSSAG